MRYLLWQDNPVSVASFVYARADRMCDSAPGLSGVVQAFDQLDMVKRRCDVM